MYVTLKGASSNLWLLRFTPRPKPLNLTDLVLDLGCSDLTYVDVVQHVGTEVSGTLVVGTACLHNNVRLRLGLHDILAQNVLVLHDYNTGRSFAVVKVAKVVEEKTAHNPPP